MKESEIDYNNLPKWVVGGINPKNGLLGFGKVYDVDEDGNVSGWRIECFATREEAQEAFDKVPKELRHPDYRVINLDQLCIRFLNSNRAP